MESITQRSFILYYKNNISIEAKALILELQK